MWPGQFIGLIQNDCRGASLPEDDNRGASPPEDDNRGASPPEDPPRPSSKRSGPYMFSPYFSRWPDRWYVRSCAMCGV